MPMVQRMPHYEHGVDGAYDGVFYVQLAMVPLLEDPAIDAALDNPAYRARRILFSWTAWAAGLGRPSWILHVYSLQNVAFWILLAWVMTWWVPPVDARRFALWVAVMFSHGLLMSVRLAVLDGPSLLLLALGVAAAERGRLWTSAAILGISGLGRETNLLGAPALPAPAGRWRIVRLAAALVLVLLPLLLWQDYIWSIYRGSSTSAGAWHIIPLAGYVEKWRVELHAVERLGLWSDASRSLLVVLSLTVQALFFAWTRAWREPWWRLGAAYAVLLLAVHYAVWEGNPGAITRVVLPMTAAFNVLLWKGTEQGRRAFWIWYAAGNLHLLVSPLAMPLF